jgi:hypothetical protein
VVDSARSQEQELKMQKRKLGTGGLEVSALELSSQELQQIEEAAAKVTVQGARYPEHLQKLVGR